MFSYWSASTYPRSSLLQKEILVLLWRLSCVSEQLHSRRPMVPLYPLAKETAVNRGIRIRSVCFTHICGSTRRLHIPSPSFLHFDHPSRQQLSFQYSGKMYLLSCFDITSSGSTSDSNVNICIVYPLSNSRCISSQSEGFVIAIQLI